VIKDLLLDRPQEIVILGKRLVVWRDSSQCWRVWEDKCPHRKVALSEGRIEGGDLMCSYHGWTFNGVTPLLPLLADTSTPLTQMDLGMAFKVMLGNSCANLACDSSLRLVQTLVSDNRLRELCSSANNAGTCGM
jgi:Rieske [2Fe-2S] domain